jgi:hypothetical protein
MPTVPVRRSPGSQDRAPCAFCLVVNSRVQPGSSYLVKGRRPVKLSSAQTAFLDPGPAPSQLQAGGTHASAPFVVYSSAVSHISRIARGPDTSAGQRLAHLSGDALCTFLFVSYSLSPPSTHSSGRQQVHATASLVLQARCRALHAFSSVISDSLSPATVSSVSHAGQLLAQQSCHQGALNVTFSHATCPPVRPVSYYRPGVGPSTFSSSRIHSRPPQRPMQASL